MSRKEKLLARFLSKPTDFTWEELTSLLTNLGYRVSQGNGARVRFMDDDRNKILLHRPHPGNIVKEYVLDDVRNKLMEHGKHG